VCKTLCVCVYSFNFFNNRKKALCARLLPHSVRNKVLKKGRDEISTQSLSLPSCCVKKSSSLRIYYSSSAVVNSIFVVSEKKPNKKRKNNFFQTYLNSGSEKNFHPLLTVCVRSLAFFIPYMSLLIFV